MDESIGGILVFEHVGVIINIEGVFIIIKELLYKLLGYKVLKNEGGTNLLVYRGGQLDFSKGLFFTTNVDTAFSFGIDKVKYSANVKVRNPIIIDAKEFNYNHIPFNNCLNAEKDSLLPLFRRFRKDKYLNNFEDKLSSDELLEFARLYGFDSVIIINVLEGMFRIPAENYPVTDIALVNPSNIFNVKVVDDKENLITENIDISMLF